MVRNTVSTQVGVGRRARSSTSSSADLLLDLQTGQQARSHPGRGGPPCRAAALCEGDRPNAAALRPLAYRCARRFRGSRRDLHRPAEKGDIRNLTNARRGGARSLWSPDGKSIAYFSDASGEYQLSCGPERQGRAKKIALDRRRHSTIAVWSPDSTKIAYTDKRLNLWYVDIAKGGATKRRHGPSRRTARLAPGRRTASGSRYANSCKQLPRRSSSTRSKRTRATRSPMA